MLRTYEDRRGTHSMSFVAMLLIVVSAVTHAAWNFVGKRERPSSSLFLIATIMGGIVMLPVVAWYREGYALIPASVLGWVVLTGLFQAVYFGMLAAAYRTGDMSLVYPLARSVPTLLVTAVALLMGTATAISNLCLAGIVLVIAGCSILPIVHFRTIKLASYLNACCCFAMIAAIGTAGYMVIDKYALAQLCELHGSPFSKVDAALIYAPLEILSTASWLALYVVFSSAERKSFVHVLRETKTQALVMGLGIYGAYTLVLVAMNFTTHVSYVMAFRQMSIPLGASLGIIALKEPSPLPKRLGVATVFAGVVLVGLG
jgi:uncharacterized membrane protein